MAQISIALSDHGTIIIKFPMDLSIDLKRKIILAWTDNFEYQQTINHIEVSSTDFQIKKSWLRNNWTDDGHEVIFEDKEKLKSLLSVSENLQKKFQELSINPEHGSEINLNFQGLKRELKEFQIYNLKNLISMPNGANFSVPGAGKTMMTLLVWEHFRLEGRLSQLLVICPHSAFESWKLEPKLVFKKEIHLHEFSDGPIPSKAELIFCNYEKLENEDRLERLKRWIQRKPTMLVLDEAHRIKAGAKSVRWRSCYELAALASRVDLLTGTPMPQGDKDLKNLLTLSWRNLPSKFLTGSYLKNLKRGGVFVRTTKDELDLPELTIKTVPLEMHELQAEIYSALRKTYGGRFGFSINDASYFAQRGKAVMTLIAAASHPGLLKSSELEDAYLGLSWPPKELSSDQNLLALLDKYLKHEMPVKFEWISKFIEVKSREQKKVLIWSTFVGNILSLERLLKPYNPAVIYGSVSDKDREQQLKKFRESDKCSVLITNAQTLGEGISLHQVCHDAIYLDRNYNAGLYLQSLDRIHRLGLPKDQETNIYILQTNHTIDLRIDHRLDLKIKKMGEFLNDKGLVEMSFPDDEEVDFENYLGMDKLDLDDLYQHLMGKDE